VIRRVWDITLTVSDLKTSVDFYENILGLQKKYQFKDYAGFDCGAIELGVKTWGYREKPRQGEPCINFLVDDLEETYCILKEKGVLFTEPPKEALWGARIALFSDPDGNLLQLSQVDWEKYFKVCSSR
jgi:catechol 2,3-dioxygenase-like lactoylglutathione lyase family enzyme